MFSKTDANLKKGQARDKNGGMSRFQVDYHFDNLIKTLNKRIEKVDVDLQAAIDAWKQAKQTNVKAEILRCRDKVSRLLAVKLRKEKYIDKIEMIKYEIDDMFDQLETARTITECTSAVSKMTNNKELKDMLTRMDKFEKIFEKNSTKIDSFIAAFDDKFEKVEATDDLTNDQEISTTLAEIEDSFVQEDPMDYTLE